MNEKQAAKKVGVALILFLGVVSSAAGQAVQVDGLTEEDINTSFTQTGVRFSTDYLNKTVSYKNVTLPQKWHDDLNYFQASFQTNNQGQKVLQVRYQFLGNQKDTLLDGKDDVPDRLGQYQFEANQQVNGNVSEQFQIQSQGNQGGLKDEQVQIQYQRTGSRERVSYTFNGESRNLSFSNPDLEFGLRGGVIQPQVSDHYEHLIVRHKVYRNHSFQNVTQETQKVYSGKDPEKLIISGDRKGINRTHFQIKNTLDNLYEKQEWEVFQTVHPENASLVEVDFEGSNYDKINIDYINYTKSELKNAGINDSFIVDNLQGRETEAFNVSVPSDQKLTFTATYKKNNFQKKENSIKIRSQPSYFSYVIGSGGALEVTSTTTLCGDVTNSNGNVYREITINATVNVCDKGAGKSGKLNLTADKKLSILSSGTINAALSGYSGPPKLSFTDGDSGGGAENCYDGKDGFGTGFGYAGQTNCGDSNLGGGGGAGFALPGGAGGDGGSGSPGSGGSSYGKDDSYNFLLGSGGSRGGLLDDCADTVKAGAGGDGGGAVYMKSSEVLVRGSVDVSGGDGGDGYGSGCEFGIATGGGGGSAGTVLIKGYNVNVSSASVIAEGGAGGYSDGGYSNGVSFPAGGAGGGSGGRLKVYYENSLYNSSISKSLSGGAGGDAEYGQSGNPGGKGVEHWEKNSSLYVDAPNAIPSIESQRFVDNRSSGNILLEFGISSNGDSDIEANNGLPSVFKFTNSTLKSDISLPFSSKVNVSDSKGAFSSNVNIDISESETVENAREEYSHSLSVQRNEKTVELSNNAADALNYSLTLQDIASTMIQGSSWSGTIPGSSSVSHVAVGEGDWISTSSSTVQELNTSKSNDLSTQYIISRDNIDLSNSKSYKFQNVDLSSQCSDTTTADAPSGTTTVKNCNVSQSSGDYLVINDTRNIKELNSSRTNDLDTQYIINHDELDVKNQKPFKFKDVSVASVCNDNTSADLASGVSTVKNCNISETTGDFINDKEISPGIPDTVTIGSNYTYKRRINVEETGGYNFNGLKMPGYKNKPVERCSRVSDYKLNLSSGETKNTSVKFNCAPGEIVSGSSSILENKPSTDFDTVKFTYNLSIASNATENSSIKIPVSEDNLPNWDDREGGSVELQVDGRSNSELGLQDKIGKVVVTVGDQFGNSSIHDGYHTGVISYYYATGSSGGSSGSGGSGGGGGGGGGGTQPTEEPESQGDLDITFTDTTLKAQLGTTSYPTFEINNFQAQQAEVSIAEKEGFKACKYVQVPQVITAAKAPNGEVGTQVKGGFGDGGVYEVPSKSQSIFNSAYVLQVKTSVRLPEEVPGLRKGDTIECPYTVSTAKNGVKHGNLTLSVAPQRSEFAKFVSTVEGFVGDPLTGSTELCMNPSKVYGNGGETCKMKTAVPHPAPNPVSASVWFLAAILVVGGGLRAVRWANPLGLGKKA